MKNGTKNQIQGTLHQAKGQVKEKTGALLSNENLETEGQDEKLAGKIQKKVDQGQKVLEK